MGTTIWSEAQPTEYYIAGPEKLPFTPELAYAVERYLWRTYRGVFIKGIEFNDQYAALTITGPMQGVGVGIVYRATEHSMEVAAKLLVENAIYTMRTYYEPKPPLEITL